MEKDEPWTVPAQREQPPRVRCKEINRQQLLLRPVEVEELVEKDHPVRAIWELVGRLNLEPFYEAIEAIEGVAGRPVWDPRLLICLWFYAYKEGISSAREIARLCRYHPAYQWLTGLEVVNYHTLADFRIRHQEALDRLFIRVLGVLSHEGLITLERVMHDGTKVKACASDKSFHRKATLEDHLRLAREQVEQMGDPQSEELSQRVAKAQQRALREKQRHLEEAIRVVEQMEASRSEGSEKKEERASSTDPEARVMLQAKGAYGPSYNVQISTDAEAKIIVGVGVTQAATDAAELEPAVERIEANIGEKPKQLVVDAGLTNQATLEAMAEKQVDLIGALPERRGVAEKRMKQRGLSPDFYPQVFEYDASADGCRCPAGKVLRYETEERAGASVRRRYRAKASDCRGCAFQAQCCPGTKRGRSVVRSEATPEMAAFQAKMETPEAQAIYKQRAGVAEFPNAWIKDKIGLRQFRLRGLVKVTLEAVWACLTYNICQWIRLCWKPQQLAQAGG
jgi:transposase